MVAYKEVLSDRLGDCRQGKQLRVMEVLQMLCAGPVTKYRIANKLEMSIRTVDRYLTQIDNLGFELRIKRVSTKRKSYEFDRYYLESCPFCKKELA